MLWKKFKNTNLFENVAMAPPPVTNPPPVKIIISVFHNLRDSFKNVSAMTCSSLLPNPLPASLSQSAYVCPFLSTPVSFLSSQRRVSFPIFLSAASPSPNVISKNYFFLHATFTIIYYRQ
ncbi:MAG: hypothetical protein NT004_12915 [Bacteroidetes bacterium]|nr:hypothetical protein [Bacteroidota bacterium]